MRFVFRRVSLLGLLIHVTACGLAESTQLETTSPNENEPQSDVSPSEVWVSAEQTPLSLREVAPGIVLTAVGVKALRCCDSD